MLRQDKPKQALEDKNKNKNKNKQTNKQTNHDVARTNVGQIKQAKKRTHDVEGTNETSIGRRQDRRTKHDVIGTNEASTTSSG